MKRDAEHRSHILLQSDLYDQASARTTIDGPIAVRPFKAGDAGAVRALFITANRLMAPPRMNAQFEDYIARALREEIDDIARYYASRGGRFYVATIADELIGMFGLERAQTHVAELRRMYVDPQVRRRGIARKLLEIAESEARKAGHTRMVLSSSELQPAALALYRAAGYREVRQGVATHATNKTLGGTVRRFHFEKTLGP